MNKPRAKPGPKPKPKPVASANSHAKAPERPTITQAEIADFRRLDRQLKELQAEVTARRRSLIRRVKQRAHVEPGLWIPQVFPKESRRFTRAIVEQAFGREAMESVLATIPPTITESLAFISEEPT